MCCGQTIWTFWQILQRNILPTLKTLTSLNTQFISIGNLIMLETIMRLDNVVMFIQNVNSNNLNNVCNTITLSWIETDH